MSHALTALSAALPLASGWAVHGLRMHRRIENARRDPLSGLWTRDAFKERATRLIARHRHVAVVLVDLDGFKAVNDTHGHEAGDAVIRATGGVSPTHSPAPATRLRGASEAMSSPLLSLFPTRALCRGFWEVSTARSPPPPPRRT